MTPPAFTGGWRWKDLHDTLIETFAEARLRAVEPSNLGLAHGQFLPATLLVVTKYMITLSTNLADNLAKGA